MSPKENYVKQLFELRGKVIALIYIFEGEDAPGAQHYWVWKSDIISGWLNAIQELECIPYIMDVRTFIQKAINKTLPHIDYILNLNCGNYELSSMSLVPAMCSFLSIPCIPCDAASIVMSENKKISNLLAEAKGLKVPKTLSPYASNGIFRPANLGSSIGIKIGKYDFENTSGLYQEFIPGYDITIPIAYNPYTLDIDLLPPLVYIPTSNSPNWIYDLAEKYGDIEKFIKLPILNIENSAYDKLLDFARTFPITTFGRIDARIKCTESMLSSKIIKRPLSLDNLYFVEINSMPTIENKDSFEMAFDIAKKEKNQNFHECINQYCNLVKHPTMIGFILSISIISFSRAKFQNQKDSIHTEV